MGELTGRVAAITGGTRGIGRAIGEAFLAEGCKVVLNGTNSDKGAQALAEIGRPDDVLFVKGDAKVREDCERVVDQAVEHFGRIDIMVNNAGGATNHAPVADLTDEALDDALKWNLWSTFWCSRKAVNYMIPQGWGRIINISSVEGKCGKPGLSIYVIAKHAINGLTKSMAQEVGTLGITVNSLCPGVIETDIVKAQGPQAAEAMGITYEQLIEYFVEESSTKKVMEVEDVAAVAMLLASEAGAGITGSLISIDGGTAPY
ncbi:MAG: 3-hydroxybutyrate dehydrogenase [Ilumatobacteraceae bacterium]|jgi:3-hydroxybutyrate dehydrogenase